MAEQKALSHTADGIRERPPRVAAIAQGVHGLMLYVEHMRNRSTYFARIAEQLHELSTLNKRQQNIGHLPPTEKLKVEDAYVRIALTAMAPSCEECDLLLLLTRPFFKSLNSCYSKLLSTNDLTVAMVQEAFTKSAKALCKNDEIAEQEEKQERTYDSVLTFCHGLHKTIEQIKSHLDSVFDISEYNELQRRLLELAKAAADLVKLHLGDQSLVDRRPSIADSARFRFIDDIVSTFTNRPFRLWLYSGASEELTFLSETDNKKLSDNLADLCRRYGLRMADGKSHRDVLSALGKSPIGRSMLRWWTIYGECYRAPDPKEASDGMAIADSLAGNPNHILSRQDDVWLLLRHRAFVATKQMKEELKGCKGIESFGTAFQKGADEYQAIAMQVQDLLRRRTQWCQVRGHDSLLSTRTESAAADPNELISALWVAERLEQPWEDQFELDALRVIQEVQREDGGFVAAEPLCHSRGFMFYASSAQTLSSLARFVTRGRIDSGDALVRKRLSRWEKVLAAGTRFLVSKMVQGTKEIAKGTTLAGWHSDRSPEIDRIDCSVTIDAVMALCRSIDAYSTLLNIEASAGFDVEWPMERVSEAIPTDCGNGNEQILPKLMNIVRELKHRTMRYREFSTGPNLARRSLLFYGPPGTGKTYFQRLIAGELQWPLIILTIGDFLAEGEDKVAARTVKIFEQLKHLSNACIVFDEFDEMVIQRSKPQKGTHSGFDLLTPAMLPLLAGLRKHTEKENCLVTFTTNYVERLDRAAKRVGRVDDEIPLIYHDFTSRLLMFLKKMPPDARHDWKHVETVVRKTGLCSHPEMRSFIEHSAIQGTRQASEAPKQALGVDFYVERLRESENDKQVIQEARLVIKSLGPSAQGFRDWSSFSRRLKTARSKKGAKN